MNNYTKEELENLILNQKLSYREIARRNKVSDATIKKWAKKLGVILPTRKIQPERWQPFNKGKKNIAKKGEKYIYQEDVGTSCKFCGNHIKKSHKIFCSFTCMGNYKKQKTTESYKNSVKNGENIAKYITIYTYKRYILEEQNNLCDICKNPNTWNSKELILILDHIDGNAANNKRDNLRCVCPNCESQLPTYKSKNKNSARKDRYIKNYKNYNEELDCFSEEEILYNIN